MAIKHVQFISKCIEICCIVLLLQVCKSWYEGFRDPVLWRTKVINLNRWGPLGEEEDYWKTGASADPISGKLIYHECFN